MTSAVVARGRREVFAGRVSHAFRWSAEDQRRSVVRRTDTCATAGVETSPGSEDAPLGSDGGVGKSRRGCVVLARKCSPLLIPPSLTLYPSSGPWKSWTCFSPPPLYPIHPPSPLPLRGHPSFPWFMAVSPPTFVSPGPRELEPFFFSFPLALEGDSPRSPDQLGTPVAS